MRATRQRGTRRRSRVPKNRSAQLSSAPSGTHLSRKEASKNSPLKLIRRVWRPEEPRGACSLRSSELNNCCLLPQLSISPASISEEHCGAADYFPGSSLSILRKMVSRFSSASLCFWILLCFFPGQLLSAAVTLDSFSISKTHEWFKLKPTVYFQCKGENKTVLPDVKKANVTYTFMGQESWQPLTNFSSEKCKRCGFYEQDTVKSDDVFDEWEFCPSEFLKSDRRYTRIKDKEFNATFICPECEHHSADSSAAPATHNEKKGMNVVLVIVISVLVSAAFIVGMVAAYKYWLKKKRQQDQARFLKLFEDGDDIEDELGLGNVL